ncbi:hypothetical protein M514_05293 [Trichuris suis]|uniref:Uncharacterized protein n=1 Tax=Trichuris suis TaxID=68888 RepID=A0A085NQ36_9BILA|nr:hypothetical protein M513_05293 [Trichuris suis]KFD71582.1 hypothetical protein M514_05293 [Trichuris suis]
MTDCVTMSDVAATTTSFFASFLSAAISGWKLANLLPSGFCSGSPFGHDWGGYLQRDVLRSCGMTVETDVRQLANCAERRVDRSKV